MRPRRGEGRDSSKLKIWYGMAFISSHIIHFYFMITGMMSRIYVLSILLLSEESAHDSPKRVAAAAMLEVMVWDIPRIYHAMSAMVWNLRALILYHPIQHLSDH